ncbi:molybdopterin converting factor subunit 1 [Thioalkalivibrio sp. XN279]|jgi:molybdopterin converting factor subunit 1|uniref:molybdopterin converting factor subunit 1 n=1 Tax=Thioalkalivibrio sp. XN279 TaxID=2714953 RepID=UPI00140A19F1|nr:molybdopterin converting factor subunit 1 [Thioalkalivibrio sp. XN279]NHA14503.1 molybdopterin converting factor subunit 1 [Thioalkalivibrio sp. XN279]
MQVQVNYFAWLREKAGCDGETLDTSAATPAQLWTELDARHDFATERRHLRVAVNDTFAEWDAALNPGDRVVFIPPVSGG